MYRSCQSILAVITKEVPLMVVPAITSMYDVYLADRVVYVFNTYAAGG